jgi:RNA polymerase sigma-70 factor (ECF subfamily)
VEELPPEFREVIVLKDLQGMTYREIAKIVSVPIGTVMSRLARGRRRLADRLCAEKGAT